MNQDFVTTTSSIIIIIRLYCLNIDMSSTPLPNIIVLQIGYTPIDTAKWWNNQTCVVILQRAMVCYFNIIIEQ